jgi:hypothetical protein
MTGSNNSLNQWALYLISNGSLRLIIYRQDGTYLELTGSAPRTGQFDYVKWTKKGNHYRLFVNGPQVADGEAVFAHPAAASVLRVGNAGPTPGSDNGFIGVQDSWRVTDGVARNETTVPTLPFPTRGPLGQTAVSKIAAFRSFALHGKGPDQGQGPFVDVSPRPKPLTRIGGVTTTTAEWRYGGSSLRFDGISGFLTSPNHVDFNFRTGPFSVRFWMRSNGAWTGQPSGNGVIGHKLDDTTKGWVVYRDGGSPSKLSMRIADSIDLTSNSDVPTDRWNYWEFCRDEDFNVYLFRNGQLDKTGYSAADIEDTAAQLWLGRAQTWGGYSFICLQDIEIIKGKCPNVSEYIPPALEFVDMVDPVDYSDS